MTPLRLTDALTLDPQVPVWACALLVGGLAGVLMWSARRWPQPEPARRRVVLLVLRGGAVLAAAILLLQPTIHWDAERAVRGEVVFLVDASRSMAIRDATSGGETVSRTEAFRRAVVAAEGAYSELAARGGIAAYGFGGRARPIRSLAPSPADPRTDPGEGLAALAGRSRLVAVVLASDGQANRDRAGPATEMARRLADEGVAVHTVGLGSPRPTGRVRDVAVSDLQAPQQVFEGNRAAVRAVVSTVGCRGRAIDLTLRSGDRVVDRRTVTPQSDRETIELSFEPVLEEAGLARLALSAEPVERELTEVNNRTETTVRVEAGGVKVLYLEGRLRTESKYIARALAKAKTVEMERRILVGPAAREALPTAAELDRFDVYVIGDLAAAALAPKVIDRMARRVDAGDAGLVMLGGLKGLAAGGWHETALADLLPVKLRPGAAAMEGEVAWRPTPTGRAHPVLDIPAAEDPFADLPPLAAASRVGPAVAGAEVLIEGPEGVPLLAVRNLGDGRTAVLAAETTWQWVLAPKEPKGPEIHARLWRNLILWLAARTGRPDADVWVLADQGRYLLTDPDRPPIVTVTAGSKGAGAPTVTLTGPEGASRRVELKPTDDETWQGRVRLAKVGTYTLRAEATVEGEKRQAATELAVEAQDLEMAHVLADHASLRAIAEAGDGTFQAADGLAALLHRLATAAGQTTEPVARHLALAQGRAFLGAFLALLVGAWALRRLWGLT